MDDTGERRRGWRRHDFQAKIRSAAGHHGFFRVFIIFLE